MAAINLLPGPVAISRRVRSALAADAFSHRSDAFNRIYEPCRQALLRLGKSKYVALLMGSGTAANAVVAQELKKLPGKGLILSNGEFGARLISQGRKAGLDFDTYVLNWGEAFGFEKIKKMLRNASWLWLAHCETCTGAMNLDPQLVAHCKSLGIKLCLDSVSSLGNQEVDFSDIYLASSTSGKGLCSFAGIAVVFYNHQPQYAQNGHDYLDLAVYHNAASVPFTFSSNLLNALCTALLTTDYTKKFRQNAKHALQVLKFLAVNGLHTPSSARQAEYIWTIVLPEEINSLTLGAALEKNGVYIHYKNRYLLKNNWIQLAFMGGCVTKEVSAGLSILERELNALAPKPP
ncbi:MAG: aminotransferase class V-fold PLP-dependent enzyme [Burkholderiaceae bacterium]|jgi:aspartate aminotransferase-like enzyme|nr:aminotransferase class V-fold PLP-dependent enzyme [Burkholderiaceae bacterium]